MRAVDGRPIFLDLLRIKQPVTAIVSITHRISGVLLFLATPALAYLFDLSLRDQAGFEAATRLLGAWWMLPLWLLLLWSVLHHLVAGIRFLLIDVHIGVARGPAVRSAWLVLASGIALAVLALAGLLL